MGLSVSPPHAPNAHGSCRRRVLSDGSLSVGPVDDSAYEGNYTCRVENIFGRDHVSYTINVLYPPAAPDFQVDAISTGALLVQWKPVKQPDAVTTAYAIVYRTGDGQPQRVDVDSDRFTYTVDRLKCGSKYAVIMRTVNTVGASGDSAVKEVYTRGGGKPRGGKKGILNINMYFVLYKRWRPASRT